MMRMMMMMAIATLVALLSTGEARAKQNVEIKKEVTKDALIRVTNVSGSLRVVGWDKSELEVTGTIGSGVEKVDVSGQPDHVQVKVEIERNSNDSSADLVLKLPTSAKVRFEVVSSSVEASALTGSLEGEAVSGSVKIDAHLKEAAIKVVSGEARVNGVLERAQVKSVSGDVTITGASGEVSVNSVSGRITLTGGVFSRATAHSVSGSIQLEGQLKNDGAYEMETHSGNIEMLLPASTSATFDVSTFSGDIKSELGGGGGAAKKKGFGPGREAHFTAGQDGARVTLKTFSGDVDVRKR
jgi:DUF4097 and DUF4098 domain-containing protein YvlB